MFRYQNALIALAFVVAIFAAGATGYWLGRSNPAQVDLVWAPIPDAVTVGWSVDDDNAIAVYVGGELRETLTPDDPNFEKWQAVLKNTREF